MIESENKNILQKITDFKNGYASITDIINALGVDLIDYDIEQLEKYIKAYKVKENRERGYLKVVLDLDNSFNNFYWKNKEELKDYINYAKNVLWDYYKDYFSDDGAYTTENTDENVKDRFYDILDMFESFEVVEK